MSSTSSSFPVALALEIVTPAEPEAHGCQLSLRIAREAKRCHERLIAAGVIGDWREPDILRLAPVPLYNSYGDVHAAVDRLAHALTLEQETVRHD